eukprot:736789-Karenia_brevis.AAC.1
MQFVLTSRSPEDWQAFGQYAGRVRQARRHMRTEYTAKSKILTSSSFEKKSREWRQQGFKVCRHGVFFRCSPT